MDGYSSVDIENMDIVVALAGGLGNRLHTLYSTHYLTMKHGLRFKYYWADDFGSKYKFHDIFDYPSIQIVDDHHDLASRTRLEGNRILTKDMLKKKLIWISPFQAKVDIDTTEPDIDMAFREIKIQDTIVKKINDTSIPNDTIGIHVRGGDIKTRTSVSPEDRRTYIEPASFFPYIDFFLSLNIKQQFFLSCENQEDESPFFDRYGTSLFIKPEQCVYNRHTVQGIIDGFINLVLLSKCHTVIGMISSFSGMSAKINNKPKTIFLQ